MSNSEASVHRRGYVDDDKRPKDIDSIYQNMNSSSASRMFHGSGFMTVKGCLHCLAQQIVAGYFDEVISVSGSSNNFIVVVEAGLS